MKTLKQSTTLLAAIFATGLSTLSAAEDCAIIFCASAPESQLEPGKKNGFVEYKADQTTVELMSRVMRKSGYQTVIRLTGGGASKAALRSAVSECKSKLRAGDRFSLYVLGHGGKTDYFVAPIFEKSNWCFVAGDQTNKVVDSAFDLVEKTGKKVVNSSGRKPANWNEKDVEAFWKGLYGDEQSKEVLQKYASTIITDKDLVDLTSEVPTAKTTLLIESCYSGLGLTAFELSRDLTGGRFETLDKKDILPEYDFIPRKSISIAESILGQGSTSRSLPRETVVVASVQGSEPALANAWKKSDVSELGYGDDWLPSTDRPMLGLFTFFLAKTWSNRQFKETPWSTMVDQLSAQFSRVSNEKGEGISQRPQLAARHLPKPFLFKQDAGEPQPKPQPAPSNQGGGSITAEFFTKNFLSLFNSDRSILDLNLAAGQLKYKAGDTLEFKLRTGAPGYLFVINFDTMGTIQLLPWAGLDLNGSTSDLLRAASCTSGQTLELGAGKYRLFAKDIGREKVKGILFKDRTLAEKFVNAWKAVSPKTEEDARRLDARAIGVQVVKLSDFYTVDLEFEVQGG